MVKITKRVKIPLNEVFALLILLYERSVKNTMLALLKILIYYFEKVV